MRLESEEPTNESQFYQLVRELTLGEIFWERVEPRDESGFPDTHFCFRDGRRGEGTVEFKYSRTKSYPRLATLLKRSQPASLLEYFAGGGRRRFCLCYAMGYSYFWDTEAMYRAILGKNSPASSEWTSCIPCGDRSLLRSWIADSLRV
jgi:hypothetical protein